MKKIRRVVLVVIALVLAYPLYLGLTIWNQSHNDEVRAADAIVVLGAAQYNGEPSPVFKARLDQALYLYDEGLSRTLIVTGGKRKGDTFTEAATAEKYLLSRDVPEGAILSETKGRTTFESLKRVRRIAREEGIDSVLLVSDPLHSARLKMMATDLGFDEAFASPASYVELNRSRATKAKELVREIGSTLVYQLLDH